MNKVSIITIAYKNFDELVETLESIDGQSNTPVESILILSGFTDDEKSKLISNYSTSYKIFWNIDDSLFNAMNRGIQKSTKEFILFLNAGDILNSSESLKLAESQIDRSRCYSFKTLQVYEDISIIRKIGLKEVFWIR